jgi:hypothetical protein
MNAPGSPPPRGTPRATARTVALAPVVLTGVAAVFFATPALEPQALPWVRENGPAELLSFAALLAAGLLLLQAAWRHPRTFGGRARAGLAIAGALGVVAALEEVSWGQSFFRFASPAGWEQVNVQNEVNVHNLEPFQELHSFALFGLGLASLAAAWWTARRAPRWRPPGVALPYLTVLTILGGLDWLTDNEPIAERFDHVVGRLVEINELWLALAALLWAAAVWARLRSRVYAAPEEVA